MGGGVGWGEGWRKGRMRNTVSDISSINHKEDDYKLGIFFAST